MKKYIIAIIMTIMVVSAKGQVTWNVRAGVGGFSVYYYIDSEYYGNDEMWPGFAFVGQVNIPFTRTSTFSLSPSFALGVGGEAGHVAFPIHVGKKIILGNRQIFYPKVGLVGGYDGDHGILGPSVELAFELKHFVMAFNYYVGLIDEHGPQHGVFATIGYKF